FSYEDIGLTLKAKPQIHVSMVPVADTINRAAGRLREISEITLDLSLEIRSLSGTSFNGIPVISNRQYTGTVRLENGEPAVVMGAISQAQQRSLSGIPGLSRLL